MTIDRAGFLRRWSERKLAAKTEAQKADAAATTEAAEQVEPFDPASLPSIESLTADSDYAAFLRPGVPAELTKAALRQAWLSDPLISTFKEMADYDWDFNAPGYGDLLPTDDVQALLSRVVNRPAPTPEPEPKPEPPEPEPPGPMAVAVATDEADSDKIFVAPPVAQAAPHAKSAADIAASQHDMNPTETLPISTKPLLRRPRHGGALPS